MRQPSSYGAGGLFWRYRLGPAERVHRRPIQDSCNYVGIEHIAADWRDAPGSKPNESGARKKRASVPPIFFRSVHGRSTICCELCRIATNPHLDNVTKIVGRQGLEGIQTFSDKRFVGQFLPAGLGLRDTRSPAPTARSGWSIG